MSVAKSVAAHGKTLLMEAALALVVRTRSLQALGIREIGREAGLNPNTFYRHFKNMDELGLAIIENVVNELREPLRKLRLEALDTLLEKGQIESGPSIAGFDLQQIHQVVRVTVRLFLEFAAKRPNAFMLGVRELHGASPVLRKALREAMANFVDDMAEDLKTRNVLPTLDDARLHQLCKVTIREMFILSMDYIEHKDQREQIALEAESMIVTLVTGAATLSSLQHNEAGKVLRAGEI